MREKKILKLTGIILCLIMLLSVMAMTVSAKTVTDISIINLEAPFPGAEMDFDADTGSDDYEIMFNGRCIFWIDEENVTEYDSDDAPVTFIQGHAYRVKVYVDTLSDNTFAANMTATINGLDANVYKDSNGYYVQMYYDECGSGEIDEVEINITAPKVGEKPSFEKIDNRRYISSGNISPEKNGIKWYDVTAGRYLVSGTTDAVFESHHLYRAIIDLETNFDYAFGNVSATVNGQKLVNGETDGVTWASPRYVTVTYTFDETGCAPEFVGSNYPSCNKTGNIGYYACSCGKWYWDEAATENIADKEEVIIPPTGAHKAVIVGAVASTCTKKGYTGDEICSVCETVIKKGVETSLKRHNEVKLSAKAATYKNEGLTEGKKCADCGKITVAQKKVARKTLKKVSGLKTKTVRLASGSKSSLTLAWSKVTGAEKYEIQQYVSKKWKTIKTTSKTYYTASKLKANKAYKFRVRAIAGTNKGSYSSTYTGKTVPLNTTLSLKAGKRYLTASWKTVANITGYEVQASTSKKFTSKTTKKVSITKAKITKTTIKKLTKGKKYYVKVRAYKTVGKTKIYSAWSSIKYVKVK